MTEKSERTRSKIVCTIGPASRSKEILAGMIEAGMDVARLNMSHDDHASHRKTFDTIRSLDESIAILMDLQGPKIRIGEMREPATLQTGDTFTLSTEDFVGDAERVSISHKDIVRDVKPGDMIAINDGIVRLTVTKVQGTEVVTKVSHGGPISSRKGVNVPGIKLSCGIPTEKDLKDLDFAAGLEPDFVALSFVTEAAEVRRVNEILKENGPKNADLICKIEHRLAIDNYDAILEECHGIMVARGDLGIEVPIEQVPVLQRDLIRKANIWARPTIVATHMLESMTHERLPTRAEVSDVAHAIFDRADAVMLSAETASGFDPVGAVRMMNRIVTNAEKRITPVDPIDLTSPKRMIVEVIANMAYGAVTLLPGKVDSIVTATRSGFTARWLSKFRPPCSIYAVARNPTVMRKMRLLWGVFPVRYDLEHDSVDDLVKESVRAVCAKGLIDSSKDIVFTSGTKYTPGRTNVLGVFHVRDLLKDST
ncbi:MAG: pyruvate kinase [Candidatus Thorarchaeota archaeon]|nr:pyruvate kinase [Candidatus Thorarchaeota archaeon]